MYKRQLYDSARGIDVPAPARRIGYLFQNYALFPHLSVRENVAFGLTAWHRRKLPPREAERVQSLLEGFGLAALADVAFVYSDGQVVREIDLHNAQSRDFALREAGGVPAAEASPLHRKLRGLLLQDATGRG